MNGPCEHCGNSDKSKWLSQCLYKGSFASRRAFVLSTFDPPCAGDAYNERQRELRRSRNGFWQWVVPVIAVLVLLAVCAKARADDPRLPPGVTCEQVRFLVAAHGKVYAYAWARLQGFSDAQINEARKCLK